MTENEAQKWLEQFEFPTDEKSDEALATICEALQEYPKYRELEQKLQSVYGEHDGLLEIIVNGLVQYENAPDKVVKAVLLTDDDVDEYNALKEKNEPKKPITYTHTHRADCPNCKATVRGIDKPFGDYCSKCGIKLDWN